MLGVTLVLVIATIIAVYWGSKTAMAFGRDVRGLLFRKVESFSQAELNHFGTPSLITRTTNDVQQVQMLVLMMLNLTLAAPIMAIGGIIMALRLDVPLSSVILVAVPVMGVFIGLVVTRALPLFRSMQKKIDRINQVTREVLSGVRVIRAFDRVGYEEQRFDVANADLTGTTLKVMRLFALMMPALTLILNLSTVAIVWFGSIQVANHGMPIGDLTAFMTYILHDPDVGAHGDLHARHGAAGLGLGRAHPAGAPRRDLGQRPRDAGRRRARARPRRVQRRGVPLPRRRGPRALAHLLHERRPAR